MTGNDAPRNLVLAGFMGTGKSTVGRLVAAARNVPFVDTDAAIEARAGLSIADIFARRGEDAFRQIEAQVCQELAAPRGQVIAVGGGALLDPHTLSALRRGGVIVCLTCALDAILARVGDDPARPLFVPDRERLAARLAARQEHYDRLPLHVDTTHLTPQAGAEEVIRLWMLHR